MNIKTTDEIGFAYPKNKKWVSCDDEVAFLERLLSKKHSLSTPLSFRDKIEKRIKHLQGEQE